MDIVSVQKRSEIMAKIRSTNTLPEIRLRSALHKCGIRFRLHRRDLPGKPDLVLPKYRAVIFVHGCFWHQHKNCADGKMPKSQTEYWAEKFAKNAERDRRTKVALKKMGWKVFVVWECEIDKKLGGTVSKLVAKLRQRKLN